MVLAAACLMGAASGGSAHDALLDARNDQLLRRAFLPSERNIHGESRLLRRGDALVLQTLLYTPQLRRGIHRMEKKEEDAWPPGHPDYAESQRYLRDLEAGKQRALERFAHRGDPADRRQKMLIELVLSPRAAFYALYEVELDLGGKEAKVLSRTPVVVRDTSREYLARALRLQAETAFDGPVPELRSAS